MLALALSGRSTGLQTPTVDQLIDRHTTAVGGRAALEAVRTVRMRLHIVEPRSVVDAVYVADRQGRMRIDVYAGGARVYSEGYDGRAAWQWPGAAARGDPESATATAALQHGVYLPGKVLGLHELRGKGIKVDAVGREVLGGTDYYLLRLSFSDGFATWLYLNPTTFLIERTRARRPLHPDLDPTVQWLETQYDDFRTVGGIVRAFRDRQVDVRAGAVLSSTELQSVQLNVPLVEAVFARPD
jgi:hypothetical protein